MPNTYYKHSLYSYILIVLKLYLQLKAGLKFLEVEPVSKFGTNREVYGHIMLKAPVINFKIKKIT